jgi:hypothetical protein
MPALRKVNFNAVSLIKEESDQSRMQNSELQHACFILKNQEKTNFLKSN